MLQQTAAAGKEVVGRHRREHDVINIIRSQTGLLQRDSGSPRSQVRGRRSGSHVIALLNPGALANPLVRGVHQLLKTAVGHQVLTEYKSSPFYDTAHASSMCPATAALGIFRVAPSYAIRFFTLPQGPLWGSHRPCRRNLDGGQTTSGSNTAHLRAAKLIPRRSASKATEKSALGGSFNLPRRGTTANCQRFTRNFWRQRRVISGSPLGHGTVMASSQLRHGQLSETKMPAALIGKSRPECPLHD